MKLLMGLLLLAAFAFGDDHGNSMSTATTLGINSTTVGTSGTIAGNIETGGDVDFFKLIVASAGDLEIYTTRDTDTYGYLYDADGGQLQYDDDSGIGLNFKMVRRNVAAGTYYVKVRHYFPSRTGRYSLYIRFRSDVPPPPDKHGNSIDTATTVELNSATQGNIVRGGDVDFFKVVLPTSTKLEIYTTGYTDTYGYLLDSAGNLIARNGASRESHNFKIVRRLVAGTYYVKVSNFYYWRAGSYTLHIESKTRDFSDDHGNRIDTATAIGLSSTTQGNIEIDGDVDFFKVVLPTSGKLEIYTTGNTDTYGYLLDSAGRTITFNDDSGEGYNFRISGRLMAGTYYIKVKNHYFSRTGRYSLHVVATPDAPDSTDDHGNSMLTATMIESNTVTQGNIGTGRDVDFFKITVPATGILTIYTSGGVDTYGYLYDSRGNMLKINDDSGIAYNFKIIDNLSAGTYYIKVRGYYSHSLGDYQLHVEFHIDTTVYTDEHDYGHGIATAIPVELPSTTQARIDGGSDIDYFKIIIPSNSGRLTIYTVSNIDTIGYLYAADGRQVQVNDDGGEGHNFKIERIGLAAGTYYLRVKGQSSRTVGDYELYLNYETVRIGPTRQTTESGRGGYQ